MLEEELYTVPSPISSFQEIWFQLLFKPLRLAEADGITLELSLTVIEFPRQMVFAGILHRSTGEG